MTERDKQDCDRCGYETSRYDVVEVAVGAVSDSWPRQGAVLVRGTEDNQPEVEEWCIDCARSEFGVGVPRDEIYQRTLWDKITDPANVFAFALAFVFWLIAFSFFAV